MSKNTIQNYNFSAIKECGINVATLCIVMSNTETRVIQKPNIKFPLLIFHPLGSFPKSDYFFLNYAQSSQAKFLNLLPTSAFRIPIQLQPLSPTCTAEMNMLRHRDCLKWRDKVLLWGLLGNWVCSYVETDMMCCAYSKYFFYVRFVSGSIVSVGDPKKKYTRFEKIGQG